MKKKILYCILNLIIILLLTIAFPISIYANQYRETTNIDNFDSNRYPGYKEALQQLKAQYPNWNFTILYTGLNWDTVVYNESTGSHGRSLVQNRTGEWLCPICGNKVLDGSNWFCASPKAVSYYLDPRNYINERDIFQFETLSYVEGICTEEGVEKILNSTFMSNASIRSYYNNEAFADKKFSTIIMEAGREAGVSPYHIASRIRQEIGATPSRSVTGNVEGYEGYYNFFNIGASGGEGAVERGLKYAQAKGWNNPEIAIKDGAKIIGNNYITKGQNTLYLEKFDVDDSYNSLYYHQYMQNIEAPLNEGRRIYDKTYLAFDMIDGSHNFVIPVYENMPSEVSAIPRADIPSNAITIPINGEVVKVIANGSLKLRESPTTDSGIITHLSTGTLATRLEKNVANANGYVWDKIMTTDGRIGYVASKYLEFVSNNNNGRNALNEDNIEIDQENKLIACNPKTMLKDIKEYFKDKTVTAQNTDGTEIVDMETSIGTSTQIIVDEVVYKISKYGDVNGDGKIKASDYVIIKNYIMGEGDFSFDAYKSNAADINRDGKIKASDYVLIKNYIMEQ